MRKVVSESEVAHFWANQTQSEARNQRNTFYYNDDTIYSYGRHFPIAKHVTNNKGIAAVLFTCRSYSSTTSGHIYTVRNASSHLNKIIAPYPNENEGYNFNYWLNAIKDIAPKLIKAHKPVIYLSRIESLYNEAKKYAEFFGYQIPELLDDAGNITNADQYRDVLIKERETVLAEQAKKDAKAEKEFKLVLAKWRNFDYQYNSLYGNNTRYSFLRYCDESNRVQTSQGVEIPVDVAKKFYTFVSDTIKAGGCKKCNATLLDMYKVNEINKEFITVGCHTITIKEIKLLTKQLGW